jgi:hypothetical protein
MSMSIDATELAAHILGIDEEDQSLYETLYETYGCDLIQLESLIEALLPMIDVGSSPLTGRRFKGFCVHGQYWVARMEVPSAPHTAKEQQP